MASQGMQVIVVGSGSAVPDPVRGNPSQAVVIDGEVLLFDCGERATVNLVRSGINPIEVDHLFFTHLHWDHIVDYNYFLMTTWNCGKENRLNVYGPPGTEEMTRAMLEAHRVDVEFVRVFVESLPEHITERPKPQPDMQVHPLHEGVVLERDSYRVSAGEVQHLNLLGFEHSSWGFRVDSDYGSVALSGDTVPCDAMVDLARAKETGPHSSGTLRQRSQGDRNGVHVLWTEEGTSDLVEDHPRRRFPIRRTHHHRRRRDEARYSGMSHDDTTSTMFS